MRGKPFVLVQVLSRSGHDSIELAERVEELVEKVSPQAPEGMTVTIAEDFSELIEHELAILRTNGLGGILIVLVILLIFLGPRISLMNL